MSHPALPGVDRRSNSRKRSRSVSLRHIDTAVKEGPGIARLVAALLSVVYACSDDATIPTTGGDGDDFDPVDLTAVFVPGRFTVWVGGEDGYLLLGMKGAAE